MRGTIRKEIKKDGSVTWGYLVYTGVDENNKKKYKRKRGFTSQHECEAALAAFINKLNEGTIITNEKMSLSEYMDYWLETYPKANCQPATYKRYKEFAKDIKKYLGMYKLNKLNPLLVQNFYSGLKAERNLSNNTIIKIHRMFHLSLKHAQKWQLLYVNPCDLVTPPASDSIEMKYWNPEDISSYLELLKDEFLYPIIYLAVHTGLREGELCALHWSDFDQFEKTLNVSKTLQRVDGKLIEKIPKTKKSSRIVTLFDSTTSFLKLLKKKDIPKKNDKKDSDKVVKFKRDEIKNNDWYIFHWDDGRPIDPHYVAQHFPEVLANHEEIPIIRFHDLRHTHATLLRKLEVNAKVISERLGHADVAFTLKTYTHVNTDMQRKEVAKAEEYL